MKRTKRYIDTPCIFYKNQALDDLANFGAASTKDAELNFDFRR